MIDTPEMTPEQEEKYYRGDRTTIDIPQTHFPDPSGQWHLVCEGKVLPEVNQEISYVVDIRGSQLEFTRDLMKWPMVDQEVRHGYVDSVDFHEELGQWSITVRSLKGNRGASHIDYGDHITYWMPMPLPPPDTYKRHAFSSHEVWNILQEKLIKAGN